MMRDFTKRQRKILDLILRLSWGCGNHYAYIPHQRDFTLVGINESDIKCELDWLVLSKIIYRDDVFYGFNKDFDEWQVSRVRPFEPEKLGELLSINLNGSREELGKTPSFIEKLGKTPSQNLVKHQEKTWQNTKFPTSDLASPKENIKKIYIYNNTYSDEEIKELDGIILKNHQSLYRSIQMLRGKIGCSKTNRELISAELNRMGISADCIAKGVDEEGAITD